MNANQLLGAVLLASSACLAGCAASPSEEAFGDAVRQTMTAQRITPEPAPDAEPSTDGQRMEAVMSVYRTMVGDPLPVVRERAVERGQ
jgi:hypothetical protein